MIKSNYSCMLDKMYAGIRICSSLSLWWMFSEMVPLSSGSWSYQSVWSPPALRLWLALTSRTLSWEHWHCALSRTNLKRAWSLPLLCFEDPWEPSSEIWFVCWRDDTKKVLQRQRPWKHDCPGTKSRRHYLPCPNCAISYLNFWLPESQK